MLEAEFWVLVAFVIFVAIVWKVGGGKALIKGLDSRGERIRAELAEARKLREDAQALLASFEKRRGEAEKEAADIVAAARDEAGRIAREAEEKLAEFIRRRTASAETKIAQAEAAAAAEVRAAAVDAAVKASEVVLRGQLAGKAAEDLLAKGLADVKRKLDA